MGLLLSAHDASSQDWEDSYSRISMAPPDRWPPMSEALLAFANEKVVHVAGRGYIGGFSRVPANTLVFPYVLIQYIEYNNKPEIDRPTHKLDDRAMLTLLRQVTQSFKSSSKLPEGIDVATFKRDYSSERARLVDLTSDGRFDIAGVTPFEDNSGVINYHTHGVVGVNGVALVTLFATTLFNEMGPIISGQMRTLAFDTGYGYDKLPAASATTTNTGTAGQPNTTPPPNNPGGGIGQGTIFDFEEDKPAPQQAPAPPPPPKPDSSNLLVILGALGVVLIVIVVIVVMVSQSSSQSKRTRSRARRHRQQHDQARR